MNNIYILLGGNLGDPFAQLHHAKRLLTDQLGILILESSIYKSEAWGVEDQPPFLNQVLLLQTTYSPQESLDICQEIEIKLGRVRKEKWGARLIDIDILYYNDLIIESENLIVPHPYIQDRKFTLEPLAEIASSYKHPKLKLSNEQLLVNCIDRLKVLKI